MRVGIGYDIHRLVRGRKLVLGGVELPHSMGTQGHSDGDALIHAVVDAALGAAGLGDIGGHFSDKDPRWKGADSRLFLRSVKKMLAAKRLRVVNVDATLILERPNVSKFKKPMAAAIARELGIAPSKVNVKAKTQEGLGVIGKGRAVASLAVVSLQGR
jgi:2-C-methyl-D-erythritol 2,4-cyclodiphosphate synthase